jgi:Ca2+-transporting ATPase
MPIQTEEKRVRLTGLSQQQVAEQRERYGWNLLTPAQREPWWKLYFEKFDDPVIRILIIAAVIAILAGLADGHYAEGIGIVIAVLLATALAFVNEYKASKEFDILNKVNDEVPVKVVRDGSYTSIPRKDLVVGDFVVIELGEEIPADGRILEAVSLQVDESKFTGESLPVSKSEPSKDGNVDGNSAIPSDVLLRGAMIVDGHAVMRVTAVGDGTEIGKTARAAAEETGEETPLNRQLEKLSKLIGVIGLGIAGLTFIALVARGAYVGELKMLAGEWAFSGILVAAVMAALAPVWLPIVYDGIEFTGKDVIRPEWLEKEGLAIWAKTVGIGSLVFIMLMAGGFGLGIIPLHPSVWIHGTAAKEFLAYFMIAVTLIVVAVPEGLAMSVTLSLAYSMRKMTASNNLVRRMHACETIGAATVICSDKTGTLTLNEMRIHATEFPSVKGKSHSDSLKGDIGYLIAQAICANSTANISRQGNEAARSLGNPTEGACLLWLEEHSVDYLLHREEFTVDHQWTFSTERKYMATLGRSARTTERIVHLKGGPEILLQHCSHVLTPEGIQILDGAKSDIQHIQQTLLGYQDRGMRTLGFAYREEKHGVVASDLKHLDNNLVWLGFVAIADPIRPEVLGAIKACSQAGLHVKMVTGDNSQTACEIARQIGLLLETDDGDSHITGADFSNLSDEEAARRMPRLKVISRARPIDKMNLVKHLQNQRHVVAVTGDGTNDAPALNHANVGLAMGKTGTSVAKEASDIILLDDSFSSIVQAVMWGRSLYQNIQRFIIFQLTINVAALAIALLGPFIGIKLPLTVIQMLWVNLIMDTFAALALATEPPNPAVMQMPPRKSDDFIVTVPMAWNIFVTAGFFLAAFIAMLLYAQKDGIVTDYELTVFFTFFVLLQFWNLFNARCFGSIRSAFSNLGESKALLLIAAAILIGQIVIVQFAGSAFRTIPLSLTDWLFLIGITSIVLWVGELSRFLKRLKGPGLEINHQPETHLQKPTQ